MPLSKNIKYLRIAIDPIYPPPDVSKWSQIKKDNFMENFTEPNKFE